MAEARVRINKASLFVLSVDDYDELSSTYLEDSKLVLKAVMAQEGKVGLPPHSLLQITCVNHAIPAA